MSNENYQTSLYAIIFKVEIQGLLQFRASNSGYIQNNSQV